MDNLIHVLQSYGLSIAEAKVYLKLWELGSVPIATLARHLGMNRVTVYSIVKNLIKAGLIVNILKNKVTYYNVISPDMLHKNLIQKTMQFGNTLPEFMAIGTTRDNKPKVEYFEGINGLKKVYQDVLDCSNKSIDIFMGVTNINTEFKAYIDEDFLPERTRRNISARVIAPESKDMIEYAKSDKSMLRKMILVDAKDFDFTNEIIIYSNDKVAIAMFSKEELTGMIITSSNMNKSLQSIFNLLFRSVSRKGSTTGKSASILTYKTQYIISSMSMVP